MNNLTLDQMKLRRIVLTEEQMKVLLQTIYTEVEVSDPEGNVLGTVRPDGSSAYIAELKRRGKSNGRRFSGKEVQNHLKLLEEAWEREGGFDEARMREILDEIRCKEPV